MILKIKYIIAYKKERDTFSGFSGFKISSFFIFGGKSNIS